MSSRGVFAEEKRLCTYTHTHNFTPLGFSWPWERCREGKLSCDATGPSFCSRAPTPRIRGRFSLTRTGIVNGRGERGGCFIFSPGSSASDACVLASCNKATAGALVTCSVLCCQAQTCRFSLRALACSPPPPPLRARPGRSPRASAAVAGVWAGCDGACCRTPRAGGGRLTVPHRGRAPFDALAAWHRGAPLPPPPFPPALGWRSQPSCRQVALVVPSCAAQLVCQAGAVRAGLALLLLPTVLCRAHTTLVPAPSQCS